MRNCDTCAFWCQREEPKGFPCACCIDTSRWEPHPLLARLEVSLPGDCDGCEWDHLPMTVFPCHACRRNTEWPDNYKPKEAATDGQTAE